MVPKDNDVRYVAFNWFRDNAKNDISICNGISIGEILAPVLWQEFCSLIHYYLEFKNVIEGQKEIVVPKDSSRLRKQIATVFSEHISYSPATNQYQNDEVQFGERDLLVTPLARLFRVAQIPCQLRKRSRKILFISTWVTKSIAQENKNSFVLFRKSLRRGAAPIYKRKYLCIGQHLFPATIDKYISATVFEETLLRIDINWDNELVELCVEHARKRYMEMRKNLVKMFALFTDLLDRYKIETCFFPEDSIPSWSILAQICKLNGINSRIYTDGYNLIPFAPLGRDKTGDGWIVDEVAAYGKAHKEMIMSLGFPEKQIIVIEPPFAKLQTKGDVKFDFIIMSWFANCLTIHGDHLSPVSTMRSALKIAIDSGAQSIGIKIKSPLEKKYILPLLIDIPITVDILEGRFFEHVTKAKAIIGGVSTAVAEATIAGIPYFIYEPPINGYSDELINGSSVLQLKKIARTPQELKDLISAGESSWTAPLVDLITS